VDRQAEIAHLALNLDAFCRRVRSGLTHATWERKRQLIEWLVARVVDPPPLKWSVLRYGFCNGPPVVNSLER
jgi:hypothetical protein